MKCQYTLVSLTSTWCPSSGSTPLETIRLLWSLSSWTISTSESISETTAVLGSLTWCVFHRHPNPRRCLTTSPTQVLAIARAVKCIHSLDVVHGNIKIVRLFFTQLWSHAYVIPDQYPHQR